MIIVELFGGLGNQMFQYAAGRDLAHRRGDILVLDTLILESARIPGTPRQFALSRFNIKAVRMRTEEIVLMKVQNGVIYTIVDLGNRRFTRITPPTNVRNVALIGWWQSESHFKESAGLLREDFTFTTVPSSPSVLENVQRIKETESVCVHVRRTDYLTGTGARMGFVGLPYYENALALMSGKIANAHFFVFSDDIEWCKANLRFDAPLVFVDSDADNAESTYGDLYLMSSCKHYIMANSSFSWWAAWLGRHAHKIVIAPAAWYADERRHVRRRENAWSSVDLVPAEWIRV